jgi:hypothetical protein
VVAVESESLPVPGWWHPWLSNCPASFVPKHVVAMGCKNNHQRFGLFTIVVFERFACRETKSCRQHLPPLDAPPESPCHYAAKLIDDSTSIVAARYWQIYLKVRDGAVRQQAAGAFPGSATQILAGICGHCLSPLTQASSYPYEHHHQAHDRFVMIIIIASWFFAFPWPTHTQRRIFS